MSLTQIFPSRGFSHFRFTSNKKSSSALKNFDLIAKSFDDNLRRRLKTLAPGSNPPPITFSWLSLAVDFLSTTHAEAQALISGLDLSGPDDSIARYLDESVKLLDVCNSISSEIERLRHRRLRINFALHLIDALGEDLEAPAPEKLQRARASLADLETHRSETSVELLIQDLAMDLGRSPLGKTSAVGKLVCRTIHAVGLVTVFIAGVLSSAVFGSEGLVSVRAPAEFPWAESFNALASAVRHELNRRFGSGEWPVLREIVDLDSRVRSLRDVMGHADGADGCRRRDGASNAVKEVGTAMEAFTEGLDGLSNGVSELFGTVLRNRNGMLGWVCKH